MSAAEKFAAALTERCSGLLDKHGQPVMGKLSSLILQSGQEGWQAIAHYRFVQKWNVSQWMDDPVAALLDVVQRDPDLEPYPASTPAFVHATDDPPAGVTVAEPLDLASGDLDDLLV